jgi:GTP-binding protein EngB required for normal cell division
MRVSYTKEKRMIAKADNLALVTIDLPGFTFQGPVDRERAEQLDKFVMQWITEKKPAPYSDAKAALRTAMRKGNHE